MLLKDSKLLSRIEQGSEGAKTAAQGAQAAAAAEGDAESATQRAGDYSKLKMLMMQLRKVGRGLASFEFNFKKYFNKNS